MSLLSFRDVVAERVGCLQPLGFTERQARFLTTVMAHSGVFLERQCCRFAGIAHGQKSHDFIDRLVQRGFARVEATRHLYQGRFYHLHHKRLYSLIGQMDNRNRKRAHRSRMIERLMLLDIVLDDRDVLWLGTESDKVRYFQERLAQYRLTPRELPHLAFGSGSNQVLRQFADKVPIGVDPLSDRYVFTYLVTRSSPLAFRSFLMRHFTLMRSLLRWSLRVFVPRKFEKAIPALKHALHEEFRRPLRPRDGEELLWYFPAASGGRATALVRAGHAVSRGGEAVQRASVQRPRKGLAPARRRCDLERLCDGPTCADSHDHQGHVEFDAFRPVDDWLRRWHTREPRGCFRSASTARTNRKGRSGHHSLPRSSSIISIQSR